MAAFRKVVEKRKRRLMKQDILLKMQKGVYYPGNHLGKRKELDILVTEGLLEPMEGSFVCGPDKQPSYCLTDKGCREKRRNNR